MHDAEAFYTASLTQRNIITNAETSLTAVVDSGFDGYMMLTRENYHALNLSLTEAPEEELPVYRTMAGIMVFRKSIAAAELSQA